MRRIRWLIFAALVAVVGCASEGMDDAPGGGKADEMDNAAIPTRGLAMLSEVADQDALEELFHSSTVDENTTIDAITQEMAARDTTVLKIKGEGIPVFTDSVSGGFDLRLGRGLSAIARAIWSGKFFTFRLEASGELNTTLQNAIIGTEIINAQVNIMTMADAMIGRGEEPPDNSLEKFGVNEEPVEVDDRPSVILDYQIESVSLFSSIIDEIRPVSDASLAAAGIERPDDVSIDDLWIGRATALFGFFDKKREFVVYFALQFDRDSIEIPAE